MVSSVIKGTPQVQKMLGAKAVASVPPRRGESPQAQPRHLRPMPLHVPEEACAAAPETPQAYASVLFRGAMRSVIVLIFSF